MWKANTAAARLPKADRVSQSIRGGGRYLGLLPFLLAITSSCAVTPPGRAPEVSVPEPCQRYKIPLAQEFRTWELGPSRLSTDEGARGTLLPLEQRVVLELRPQSRSRFEPGATQPAQRPRGFGGRVPVRVASSGTYKFAIGGEARLELVNHDRAAIPAEGREAHRRCPSIAEVLTFHLDGGRDYVLRISASREPDLDLLISKLEND